MDAHFFYTRACNFVSLACCSSATVIASSTLDAVQHVASFPATAAAHVRIPAPSQNAERRRMMVIAPHCRNHAPVGRLGNSSLQ